jgi:hypothetical protein
MALVTHTVKDWGKYAFTYIWKDILNGGTADAITPLEYTNAAVQVTGVPNGGTITIQGSIDGTNFTTLHDVSNSALSFAAAGGPTNILEHVPYIQPVLASGWASTDLNVYVYVMSTARG